MDKRIYFTGLFSLIQSIVLAFLLMPVAAVSDEAILTAADVNDSLKRMQRIQLEMEAAKPAERPEYYFRLGIEADNLALLLTNEVILNNMRQVELIDLAMERTHEIGVDFHWLADKRRFIYEGEGFRQYLELSPQGENAAESAYRLLEHEFFLSTGDDDVEILAASAARKQDFLNKYTKNTRGPRVGILLAVDYRDIWRSYRDSGDEENALQYSEKTRNQFVWITETYPDAQEAGIAQGLLQRFEAELEAYTAGDLVEKEGG